MYKYDFMEKTSKWSKYISPSASNNKIIFCYISPFSFKTNINFFKLKLTQTHSPIHTLGKESKVFQNFIEHK